MVSAKIIQTLLTVLVASTSGSAELQTNVYLQHGCAMVENIVMINQMKMCPSVTMFGHAQKTMFPFGILTLVSVQFEFCLKAADFQAMIDHMVCVHTGYTRCYDDGILCNGIREVTGIDSPDEWDCEMHNCSQGLWKCAGSHICISVYAVCDGDFDCGRNDRSDEDNCQQHNCVEGWKKCGDGSKCIKEKYFCDRVKDCPDKSDELREYCDNKPCADGLGTCDNHKCIRLSWICNGSPNCDDALDEKREFCCVPSFQWHFALMKPNLLK